MDVAGTIPYSIFPLLDHCLGGLLDWVPYCPHSLLGQLLANCVDKARLFFFWERKVVIFSFLFLGDIPKRFRLTPDELDSVEGSDDVEVLSLIYLA